MKKILEKVLKRIKLDEKELEKMNFCIEKFVEALNKEIKRNKIKAEVFVGGSSGKGTVVKRKKQDIDIFIRFSKKYKDNRLSELLGKILKKFRKRKIHGSRDYFKIFFEGFNFEVVPVLKIGRPEEARNVTDLSYFHVSYVKRILEKNPRLADEIRLAKTFCFANNVYGAESYIRGFSGYSLELLIIYYGSFINLIKEMTKLKVDKKKKLVIDLKGYYKNKEEIMQELNESKLDSPIIFIDPTFKERNVLAGLSYETFFRFKEVCKFFLSKPSIKFFVRQKVDRKKFNLILKAKTSRQEGDIAGSKLWKFFKLFSRELEKYFEVREKRFEYDEGKEADLYFKVKKKKEILISGPPITSIENVIKFKKRHKRIVIKNNRVYAKEKGKSLKDFLCEFKKDNKERMRDMGITGLRLG